MSGGQLSQLMIGIQKDFNRLQLSLGPKKQDQDIPVNSGILMCNSISQLNTFGGGSLTLSWSSQAVKSSFLTQQLPLKYQSWHANVIMKLFWIPNNGERNLNNTLLSSETLNPFSLSAEQEPNTHGTLITTNLLYLAQLKLYVCTLPLDLTFREARLALTKWKIISNTY